MDFSSKLLELAVDQMSQLPGIGKRTALRLVLHLLKQPKEQTEGIVSALHMFRSEIIFCCECHNIADTAVCEICANPRRTDEQICVVEDIRDVMAIENTGQFQGKYHVLNGIISPIDGVGPYSINGRNNTIQNMVFSLKLTCVFYGHYISNIFNYADLFVGPSRVGTDFTNSSISNVVAFATKNNLRSKHMQRRNNSFGLLFWLFQQM